MNRLPRSHHAPLNRNGVYDAPEVDRSQRQRGVPGNESGPRPGTAQPGNWSGRTEISRANPRSARPEALRRCRGHARELRETEPSAMFSRRHQHRAVIGLGSGSSARRRPQFKQANTVMTRPAFRSTARSNNMLPLHLSQVTMLEP